MVRISHCVLQNTAIFDIKSVPSEHGPSISGLNQSIKGYAAVIDNYPIRSSNYEQNLYMAQISFFQPNLVIDPRQGKLWDIELRLGIVSKNEKRILLDGSVPKCNGTMYPSLYLKTFVR